MEIPPTEIAAAKKLRACAPAITWLRKKPRTTKELVKHNPEWAAWIVECVPAYAERAWSALLARPGGPSEGSLRHIVAYAPADYKREARARLARKIK